jgi:hypothetical protein
VRSLIIRTCWEQEFTASITPTVGCPRSRMSNWRNCAETGSAARSGALLRLQRRGCQRSRAGPQDQVHRGFRGRFRFGASCTTKTGALREVKGETARQAEPPATGSLSHAACPDCSWRRRSSFVACGARMAVHSAAGRGTQKPSGRRSARPTGGVGSRRTRLRTFRPWGGPGRDEVDAAGFVREDCPAARALLFGAAWHSTIATGSSFPGGNVTATRKTAECEASTSSTSLGKIEYPPLGISFGPARQTDQPETVANRQVAVRSQPPPAARARRTRLQYLPVTPGPRIWHPRLHRPRPAACSSATRTRNGVHRTRCPRACAARRGRTWQHRRVRPFRRR